jgi:outer membrane protein OmpA-like peptidoglycan-associated protein
LSMRFEVHETLKRRGAMRPKSSILRVFPAMAVLVLLSFLVGCAGMEWAPKRGVAYYPKELVAADRAVEAARQAGKDKQCPVEFAAAEKKKNDAYSVYLSCRTKEGIAMALEATSMANALCPVRAMAPPPPPPPAPAPAPEPIVVPPPPAPAPAPEPIVVPAPPAPAPAARVIDRLTLHVNFDFDKSVVRKADDAELQKAVEFVKKYSGYQVSIEGHTDSIGTDKYNQALSERRAAAVKAYLVKQGVVDNQRITSVGYGESKPIADNKTNKGRFENRRVEILILSE